MGILNWGLIGGGEYSQIGVVHRMAAPLDGDFRLVAGALDVDPVASRAYGRQLGIDPDRAYGDWREMLASERTRPDRPDLITVATPNATHFAITRACLEAGFHVLCEKPLTVTVREAEQIVDLADVSGRICAVNYGYSGYPMVRQMRAMVFHGELGKIRLVFAMFSHGQHAAGDDADNPRVRWRYDPEAVGVSAQFADCGIHALHLATFVTGQAVTRISADFASCVANRALEDDAMVNFRMRGGAVGRLWTSAVAVGRQHGLGIEVFGERGGLCWMQERPEQLFWTPVGGRTEIIERGESAMSGMAARASRTAIGHVEGMPLAFANIYSELAGTIRARSSRNKDEDYLFPTAMDGLRSMQAIRATVESAAQNGQWLDLPCIP